MYFIVPVQSCSLSRGDAAKLFTESGNHSHASGDGKIQPRHAGRMLAFGGTINDGHLIERSGRRIFHLPSIVIARSAGLQWDARGGSDGSYFGM